MITEDTYNKFVIRLTNGDSIIKRGYIDEEEAKKQIKAKYPTWNKIVSSNADYVHKVYNAEYL